MKKELLVFLCVIAVLLFGSCAELSIDNETALKADLPEDFDWQVYAEINKDVAMSQIILDVREKNKEYGKGQDSTKAAVENCVNLLSSGDNFAFAEEVYLNYVNCPRRGWILNDKCSTEEVEAYASNERYSTTRDSTSWQCVIANCWSGGWDENSAKYEQCTGDAEQDADKNWCASTSLIPLKDTLESSLEIFKDSSTTSITAVTTMCQFLPKKATVEEAKNYLENFELDKTLVKEHYHFIGRYDGKPYKYCEPNSKGEEKSRSLEKVRRSGNYYDYGQYTFCLDKENYKVYVIK